MTLFGRRTVAMAFLAALIAFGCVSGVAVTAGPATVQSPQSPAEAPVIATTGCGRMSRRIASVDWVLG